MLLAALFYGEAAAGADGEFKAVAGAGAGAVAGTATFFLHVRGSLLSSTSGEADFLAGRDALAIAVPDACFALFATACAAKTEALMLSGNELLLTVVCGSIWVGGLQRVSRESDGAAVGFSGAGVFVVTDVSGRAGMVCVEVRRAVGVVTGWVV